MLQLAGIPAIEISGYIVGTEVGHSWNAIYLDGCWQMVDATWDCSQQITKKIPVSGHTEMKDKAVEPTCTEPGKTEGSHCSVCGEVLKAQEVVPATGHTPVKDEAVAPTCTEPGKTEGRHCSVCGEVIKERSKVRIQ